MAWKREEAVDVEAVWDMGEVGAWNDPQVSCGKEENEPCTGRRRWLLPQCHMAETRKIDAQIQ